MTKEQAIAEILKQAPLLLDHSTRQFNKEKEIHEEVTFADEHKFVIEVTAGAFRALRK